eukprot:scaffold8469_cov112-Isochrysis_galbana.AAC.5
MAMWDDLPPELVAKILSMRGASMKMDAEQERVRKIITDAVWREVWRARPRVFRQKLRAVTSHGEVLHPHLRT